MTNLSSHWLTKKKKKKVTTESRADYHFCQVSKKWADPQNGPGNALELNEHSRTVRLTNEKTGMGILFRPQGLLSKRAGSVV